MKATAIAPTNIAFIKYMGRKDEVLRLPENASISMCLDHLLTTTTVEFSPRFKRDDITINGEQEERETSRVTRHLDRIRTLAKIDDRAKVVSNNNFPTGTGLSSSSSGFAALTLAATGAAGLKLSEKELSILARQASGSACRSIPDGFVEWADADTNQTSFGKTIFSPDHWDIVDVVAVVSTGRKTVKSSTAHQSVASGPYYRARIDRMPEKVRRCKALIRSKDFPAFGALCEEEALDLHVIFMSAGIIYLTPQSLELIKLVPQWRAAGLPVYFTLNTGQDVHLLCEKKDVSAVWQKLNSLDFVRDIIVNEPARGARVTGEDLF